MDYDKMLNQLIKDALAEDIGTGDFSTLSCIDKQAKGKAVLKIKQEGILAGIQVAEKIFNFMQPGILFVSHKQDGDQMNAGQIAFEVFADVHTILMCERLVLNCMQRMSGIATLTNKYVQQMAGCHARLLDTRKTTPNFRLLEKEAVKIGGGLNHRFGLYDMIMLKDNHIDYCGGITKAIERANNYIAENDLNLKIEIETRTLADVNEVLEVGKVHRIMLDNFLPAEIEKAVEMIGGRFETEASGGITLQNIRRYAQTGVDFVSSGAIIHQAKSLDLSLKAAIVS